MSSRQEQLGMLGVLSGDPAVSAVGEQLLANARAQAKASGKRVHIGNGFIMEPDGTVGQDPKYAEFIQSQSDARDERQNRQNSAMLERMFVASGLQRSQPRYSAEQTDYGQAILQTNPQAFGGARVETEIPFTPPIRPEARQKAAEAERLAAEAAALQEQLGSVEAVKPGVDIPSDWLRQSDMTRGLSHMLERQFYDPHELEVRARGNRFEQNLSNLAAGLALTGYEIAERQKWSPFAPGLTRAQAKDRLTNVIRDFSTKAETIRGVRRPQQAQPTQSILRRKTLNGVAYVEVAPGEWEVDDGQ